MDRYCIILNKEVILYYVTEIEAIAAFDASRAVLEKLDRQHRGRLVQGLHYACYWTPNHKLVRCPLHEVDDYIRR